jgi:hypothetical protein
MSLKDELKKVDTKVKATSDLVIAGTQTQNIVPARSYPSPVATYEEDSQFQNPFDRTNVTMRTMWRIQGSAVQQTKVITTALPQAISATGVIVSPFTTSTGLVAVPDCTIAIQAIGVQLQISWNISASLSLNTSTASFALFRDGVKIGQTQYGQSVANNQKFSVTQTILDNPPLGFHAYAIYWATTAGTLTADQKSRSVSALILRPQ